MFSAESIEHGHVCCMCGVSENGVVKSHGVDTVWIRFYYELYLNKSIHCRSPKAYGQKTQNDNISYSPCILFHNVKSPTIAVLFLTKWSCQDSKRYHILKLKLISIIVKNIVSVSKMCKSNMRNKKAHTNLQFLSSLFVKVGSLLCCIILYFQWNKLLLYFLSFNFHL